MSCQNIHYTTVKQPVLNVRMDSCSAAVVSDLSARSTIWRSIGLVSTKGMNGKVGFCRIWTKSQNKYCKAFYRALNSVCPLLLFIIVINVSKFRFFIYCNIELNFIFKWCFNFEKVGYVSKEFILSKMIIAFSVQSFSFVF